MSSENGYDTVSPAEFDHVFQMMCNFVAVAESSSVDETVAGLLSLVLFLTTDDPIRSESDFQKLAADWFGIALDKHRVTSALEVLEERTLVQRTSGRYTLSHDAHSKLQETTNGANELESRVRERWLQDCKDGGINLNADKLWSALQRYLFFAFRRHGLQTVALIDPRIDVPKDISASLTSLLREAVNEKFEPVNRQNAEQALTAFLSDVETDADRSKYVVHLADGAFSFYSLQVDPELAKSLRERLNELTLFLDTNFLFGLLDLHSHHQVDVSKALVHEVSDHELPFKLRYHQATHQETRNTLAYNGDKLRGKLWNSAFSRSVVQSQRLTGLELKFHEANAVDSLNVEDFLRPYQHFDKLLKEDGIEIHRVANLDMQKKVEIWEDYNEYLKQQLGREKPYGVVQHDAVVLDHVRRMRTRRYSPLKAGTLFVTCDYYLYRYEWERARAEKRPACVILPNQLWQMLRPFVPRDQQFDQCFAKTFAIPEFRTISSMGAKAASRMVQMMASFKDVKPSTALDMLRDDVLLGKLAKAKTDEEFSTQVEAAFVQRNSELEEEKAAVEQELERKLQKERELRQVVERQSREITSASTRTDRLKRQYELEQQESEQAFARAKEIEEQKAKLEAELSSTREKVEGYKSQLSDKGKEAEQLTKVLTLLRKIAAVILFVLLSGVIVVVFNIVEPAWLIARNSRYAAEVCLLLLILEGTSVLFFDRVWRERWFKWAGPSFAIASLFGAIAFLLA